MTNLTNKELLEKLKPCCDFFYMDEAYSQLEQRLRQEPMEEPTDEERKEMLDLIDALKNNRAIVVRSAIYDKIRLLILSKPTVSRDFVATLAGETSTTNWTKKNPVEVFEFFMKRFKEAGIKVEGR